MFFHYKKHNTVEIADGKPLFVIFISLEQEKQLTCHNTIHTKFKTLDSEKI